MITNRSVIARDERQAESSWVQFSNGKERNIYTMLDGSQWVWNGKTYERISHWQIIDNTAVFIWWDGRMTKHRILRHGTAVMGKPTVVEDFTQGKAVPGSTTN